MNRTFTPARVGTTAGTVAAGDDTRLRRYTQTPPDQGFLAWTGDIYTVPSGSVPTVAGRLEIFRIKHPSGTAVTNVCLGMTSAGSGLTTGQCFAGLWTAAGARVGVTADQSTAWASGLGVKTMALTGGPYSCPAGDYYIGFWYNGTTSPGWMRWSGLGGAYFNVNLTAPNLRVATADTGLTTTSPATLGTQTAAALTWWGALS